MHKNTRGSSTVWSMASRWGLYPYHAQPAGPLDREVKHVFEELQPTRPHDSTPQALLVVGRGSCQLAHTSGGP